MSQQSAKAMPQELPRQRQVFHVTVATRGDLDVVLTSIADNGGLVFQVLRDGDVREIIWWTFED